MLRLDVINLATIKQQLGEFARELDDFTDLWADVAEIMVSHELETFATEGFGEWEPLAESTVRQKYMLGFPPEPMIRTTDLIESLTDPDQAALLEQGRTTLGTFGSKSFSWGTDVENERGDTYAEYHQDGPLHNPNLPVRNVIILTPELDLRIEQAAVDFVQDKLEEAGLD